MRALVIFFTCIICLHSNGADEIFCKDNLSWYNDCIDSFFFNEDSKRCKEKLVYDYAAALSGPLNMHLRGIEEDVTCEPILDKMYEAMSNLDISKEKTFYRGVRHFSTLDQINVGDCLVDKGYFSTSLLEKVARNFTDKKDEILFEIVATGGRERMKLGGYSHEAEIIFLPSTVLKLMRINFKQKIWGSEKKLYFEEVEKSECRSILH